MDVEGFGETGARSVADDGQERRLDRSDQARRLPIARTTWPVVVGGRHTVDYPGLGYGGQGHVVGCFDVESCVLDNDPFPHKAGPEG